jgi:transcriptional regulator
MPKRRKDTLQGTLDMLVLRTLRTGEAQHGYSIADRIQQISADDLRVEEGSLYPALHRMEEAGWVKAEWKTSENNRRARYYRITGKGRDHLSAIEHEWARHVKAVMRVLRLA